VLHDRQGKFQESAEEYRRAVAARPNNPDVYCDLGYSLYLQRRWAEAEASLVQALTLDREHRRAHNNLALVLARTERLEPAVTEFRLGGSTTAESYVNLAFVLTLERRWDLAAAYYRQALAADPKCDAARTCLHNLQQLVSRARPPGPAPTPVANGIVAPAATAPADDTSVARTFFRLP
jgi:Flp pilus assembly protein TadD